MTLETHPSIKEKNEIMSKSIAKNAAFNVGHKAVAVVFPLVTSVYIARTLGASGVGEVSSAQNLVTYFTMIAALGIPSYGVRAIAQSKNNKDDRNRTFSELFIINFLSTMVALLGYGVLIVIIDKSIFSNGLHVIFATLIVMNIFNIEWLYQGFEEYKYITIRSISVKIISLLLMFLFVRTEKDVNAYALIICFGSVGNYALNAVQLRKYVNFTISELNFKRHLKPIFTFFASVIAVEIYTLLDVTMLTYMCHPESVGYYANAAKIVKIVANTITAIGTVLLPRLSLYFGNRDENQIKKIVSDFFDVITMFSLPCCVGIFLTANEFIPVLFGNGFQPAAVTVKYLCLLAVLLPLSGGIFAQILQTSGREKDYFVCVCIGAFVNIVLNALLIVRLQENGAALASVLTEFCVNITMFLYCRRVIRIQYISRDFISSLISCVMLAVAVIFIRLLAPIHSLLALLLLEVCVGMVAYAAGLLLLHNSKCYMVLKKLHIKR